jgi:hypothetical protein
MPIAVWLPSSAASAYDGALVGTLEPHPLNPAFKAVKLTNGNALTVTPQGTLRLNTPDDAWDKAQGWQAFQVSTSGSFLIAGRDGVPFMLPYVTFDGPAFP